MKLHSAFALLCAVTLFSCYKPHLSNDLGGDDPRRKNAKGQLALDAIIYYVATNGDDANDGSLGTPFHTIQKALSVAAPGDEIQVRGGTYTEKLRFPVSGTPGAYITLKEYPGESAVISGQGLSITGREALVAIDGAQYIAVEGFEISGLSSAEGTPVGIAVTGGSDFIRLADNELHHINYESETPGGKSHAILVDAPTADSADHILITGNSIHDNMNGEGAALALQGYVTSFSITANTVYNCTNTGISVAGGLQPGSAVFRVANIGAIQGNTVYNIHAPVTGNASGILVRNSANVITEQNKVSDADLGIGLMGDGPMSLSRQNYIRNNFIHHCTGSGIHLGWPGGNTVNGNSIAFIVNNTLLLNGANGSAELLHWGNARLSGIRNNIIYARPGGIFLDIHPINTVDVTSATNLYYTTGAGQWRRNGSTSTALVYWQLSSGTLDLGSTEGLDPLLTDITAANADLHILPASPAKNTGTNLVFSGTLDIDSQPRTVGLMDKGADELQ